MSAGAKRMLWAWAGLQLLLALTLGAAFLPLGAVKPWLGYLIAAAKTGLVLWIFMEMRRESGLIRLASASGFVWLAALLVLAASDYLSRG